MSLYDVILKELDLNEGDEFVLIGNGFPSGYVRKFENGQMLASCSKGIWEKSQIQVNRIIEEDFELKITKRAPWVPEDLECYFAPNLLSKDLYLEFMNTGYELDGLYIERKIAFKTPEEAIACAKKMLEVIK